MNNELPSEKQSVSLDIKTAKRNSGLFSFLKWFKNSGTSKESINSESSTTCSTSGSVESVDSTYSTGTVASFSFVAPDAYRNRVTEKCIAPGPETDTYKARLKQREKNREKDKNITLRKKYNLFFNRDTLLKPPSVIEEDNSKSLPLMTKKTTEKEQDRLHRRAASESSKIRKAGAYCHVKGKRKAPQPPNKQDSLSLRRQKRTAPTPPWDKSQKYEIIEFADENVICNDSLKLDHGILKPAKQEQMQVDMSSPNSCRSSYIEPPVSPRPWYKRNVASGVKKDKHEAETLPDLQYVRNNTDLNLEETKIEKRKEDKRKSGISFLTNISELDREAAELLKKEKEVVLNDIPAFMRPKPEQMSTDSLASPKRKSAKDLIAKFNAITNVTKVTVNAFQRDKREFFNGKVTKVQEIKRLTKKPQTENLPNPLMKSESVSVMKPVTETKETPKAERKSWCCPKCYLENDYWRIICHVCSTIKPYFDDLSTSPTRNAMANKTETENEVVRVIKPQELFERNLERSKTQIGFSALARYNEQKDKKLEKSVSHEEKAKELPETKKEEREKLIKMLIEMKNSLPKRKISASKENNRTSIIKEGLEVLESEFVNISDEQNSSTKETKTIEEITPKKVEAVAILEKDSDKKKCVTKNNEPAKKKQDVSKIPTNTDIVNLRTKKTVSESNMTDQKQKISVKTNAVAIKIEKEDIKKMFLLNNKNQPPKIKEDDVKDKDNIQNIVKVDQINNERINDKQKEKPVIVKEEVKQNILKAGITSPAKIVDMKASEKLNKKEVTLVTQKTIYENIKVNKSELLKPAKVSSSAQTSAVVRKTPTATGAVKKDANFELMRPKDFADIYNEKTGQSADRLYSNLCENDMSVFVNIPKNLGELKDCFDSSKLPNNTDTLEINRLLRRLETAIAKGELTDAAVFARELAQLKVNCSVIRQKENNKSDQTKQIEFSVSMFVEDKLSHRGPFPIQVTADKTVGELKQQVENDFEIPVNVQRWILGKELATNDNLTLKDHHVTTSGSPVFLYLVASNRDTKLVNEKTNEQLNIKPVGSKIQSQQSEDVKVQDDESKTSSVTQNTEPKAQEFCILKNDKDLAQPSTSQSVNTTKGVTNETITVTVIENKLQSANNYRKSSTFDEDFDEYDCKTLKPQAKEWECRMCTLLNPPSSNICAVCATVRQTEQLTPKAVKRKAPQPKGNAEAKALHLQLLDLDNSDLVGNNEAFECMVCLMDIAVGGGVILRECLHQFCKDCLAHTVEFTDEAEIKCPYRDEQYSCDIALQDREIKALVPRNIYEQYLARSVTQAENKTEKSFHCKTPDCKGWCIFEDNVNEFRCPVCQKLNCLTCQAIHVGMNCKQYQERMNAESEVDDNAKRTREMLEEMVNKGEALTCPACQVILMKKWGCDWVRCSMCKTEICWVTKGPRWGPGGKGDTSGGCKCGVNGVKCHVQCNYCH